MSLIETHKNYIEKLRKDYYSNNTQELPESCKLECVRPQVIGLSFGFISPLKKMYVMDTLNNIKIKL